MGGRATSYSASRNLEGNLSQGLTGLEKPHALINKE
jgi:hypothetical protein